MPNPFAGRFGKPKAIDIKKKLYAMATIDGKNAEITMYGEVVQKRPRDLYGEPIDGDFIILSEFLADLELIAGAKNIVIRMNSLGGDVYAALPIHNRLRELKANITVIIDGVAMSAASFIMCAADKVQVHSASLVMIHKAWAFLWGGYNADEMRDHASYLDTVDKTIASAYVRKSGLSEEEVISLMADTTYMTGQEAVDRGFADELIEGEAPMIAASADGGALYVNGRRVLLSSPLSNLPEGIKTVTAGANPDEANKKLPGSPAKEGGNPIMARNFEELRAENPALAATIAAELGQSATPDESALNAARDAERQRIAEIDAIASTLPDAMVAEAKYGATACTAQELAFRALQNAATKGTQALANMKADTTNSGANSVNASPGTGADDGESPNAVAADAKSAAAAYLERRGGRR
jgi:ATP-dependent protease ClpP protease subunit